MDGTDRGPLHVYRLTKLVVLLSAQELELAVDNSRGAHKLLSRHLALDPFPELLAEANESVTGLGRMRLHVFSELCVSVIPNFCYNSGTRRYGACCAIVLLA
jgi:hypothetical protein